MDSIVDLARFPLDRPESGQGVELVRRCRRELRASGMFNLAGFLRPGAVRRAVSEITPVLESGAFLHQRRHNIYFEHRISGLDADHPALARQVTSNRTICADQIRSSVLVKLYEWPPFAKFLASALEMTRLYTMADPLARVNVMAYGDGQALNWHFDRSEFTTTLLLQSPDQGGEFEYRTDLRTDDNPNYDGVAKLLNGKDPQKKTLRLTAGTLNVFRGKNTAHRVTPVIGEKARIVAVFSYYQKPGVKFSEAERIGFYGRA